METMPVASGIDAFAAFQNQLRTLCLNEFPCGSGSWRTSTERNIPDTHFAVTLKDYSADKEQEETLEELVTSKFSPYSVDYSWSDEAKALREIAVKSPWLITQEFIHKHFKTLRVVNKNVSQLDASLLQLTNLEELSVSVNHITTVHSHNIPKNVKRLELVANAIDDLEQLCEDPPVELQHLGLGMNKISAIHDYLSGAYWPCLLSLDLSHNNLCDLIDIINKLSSLPKLRNLVLLGNPLALIPGYRGYTVDSLRKLSILDDLQISADEKHHYKGLARRKEFILDEAKVIVTISAAGGIPKPAELQNTEETPQYPITTRTYYVEFMFLEDFQAKTKSASESKASEESKKAESKDADQEKDVVANGDAAVNHASADGDKEDQPAVTTEKDGTFFTQSDSPTPHPPKSEELPNPISSQSPPPTLKLVPYRTKGLRWTEEGFEYKFTKELVIDDLPALKEYFKKGMPLAIKEDKVLSNPAVTDENSEEGKNGKAKDKPVEKKKRKKEPEIELIHSPPEVTLLGTCNLELVDIIEGEYVIEEKCTCKREGGTADEGETAKEEEDSAEAKKEKKKKDRGESTKGKKGKGDGKDSKEGKDKDKDKVPSAKQGSLNSRATSRVTVTASRASRVTSGAVGSGRVLRIVTGGDGDGKKQAQKPDKKDSKAKRPGSGKSQHSDDEEEKAPPPPLTISISVELQHWKTAQDSIPKVTVMDKMAALDEAIRE